MTHPQTAPVLAVALDFSDLDEALTVARAVRPWCPIAKVGLQLYTSVGPGAVRALVDEGHEVFLDLKLHDIPNTVRRAAEAAGRIGASFLTAHAAGGAEMLAAAVSGFEAGRAPLVDRGNAGVLAVTVLTSEPDPPSGLVEERCRLAASTGCAGVVCAGAEILTARAVSPELVVLVPGIRAAGQSTDDQARVTTPGDAARAGASVLVVGRTVTAASDPAAAAASIAAEVAWAISPG